MFYGFYYGAVLAATTVVPPEETLPIAVPSTTFEPEPVDHLAEAINRLLEQYKP